MTLNSMYSLLVELPAGVMPTREGRGGVDGAYVDNEPALRCIAQARAVCVRRAVHLRGA